jgi:RimJ/RimL family protein N-acetyltransferase
MKTVVYGQDQRICKWVGDRVDEDNFGSGAIAIGLEDDGELIAGVVFNMYTGPSISMHVAAVPGSYWLNRDFLWRSFAYPFIQLGCRRVTALVRSDNAASHRFVRHLGFTEEGLLRRACTDGMDMVVYGMLLEECRWLGVKHGAMAYN